MKFGQSVAMLAFTSLAILGTTQNLNANDIVASAFGLRIVAFAAMGFCIAGAIILLAYNEKKVMSTILKKYTQKPDNSPVEPAESVSDPEPAEPAEVSSGEDKAE